MDGSHVCTEGESMSKQSEYMKIYNQTHREQYREYQKKWERDHIEWRREYRRIDYKKNRTKILLQRKLIRDNHRKEIFNLLGRKCVKCEESDVRCLQIDHINGGGRKEAKSVNSQAFYRNILTKIRNGSKDYQILCANCNWRKRDENGETLYGR